MHELLLIFTLLIVKHFIVDFPLQTKYQWSNKGTYGHPGGILHSGLHGIGTYLCLFWYAPIAAVYLALADMVIHYHVDWAKMNLNAKMGWGPNTHEEFWWLLGLDQLLHYLTYVVIVWCIF
jgi:hypothetical protein